MIDTTRERTSSLSSTQMLALCISAATEKVSEWVSVSGCFYVFVRVTEVMSGKIEAQ